MNIKDLPQGSYKVIQPGSLNIKDLPQDSYKVVSGNVPAKPLTGKEQRLAKATGQAPVAPVVPETTGYQDTSGPFGFLKARANQLNESLTRGETGQQTAGETGFQFMGNTVAGPAMDILGKILTPIDKARQVLLNQGAGRVANIATGRGNVPVKDESPLDYLSPRAAANAESGLNILQAGMMLGGGGKAKEKVQQEFQAAADRKAAAPPKPSKVSLKREAELKQIENNYQSLRKMKDYSTEFDASRSRVAKTDVLHNSVNTDGKIATKQPGGAVEQYKKMTIDDAEGVVRKNLVREGRAVSVKTVENALTQEVQNSGLEGADLRNALNKVKKEVAGYRLKADANGNIPLEVVHDAKVNTYNNTNYLTPPDVAKYNKTLARGLKKVVEQNSDLPVSDINKELGNYLQDIKYLETLDGKIVKGGRLGKLFAQTSGSVMGSIFGHAIGGPFGSIASGILGSEVATRIMNRRLSSVLQGKTGNVIERSNMLNEHIKLGDTPPEPITVKNYFSRNRAQSNPATTPNSTDTSIKLFTKRDTAPKQTVRPADLQDYAKLYAKDKAKQFIKVTDYANPHFPKYIPKTLSDISGAIKTSNLDLLTEAKKYKTAEEFVNAQFAKKPEYGMSHRPSYEGMPPSYNLLEGETLPRDVYTHPDYSIASGRIRGGEKAANESWNALQKIKDKPDAEITVYRAGRANKLNTGDWVTFSKDYAKQSLEGNVEKVYSFKVKAKDVIFAGDDINEFGYYPKSQLTDIWKKANSK